ncbi:MAG: protein kinase [Deltaproteobacteria bacterium]|nr:protein kinase [Deltaproteobacteria bacterium]
MSPNAGAARLSGSVLAGRYRLGRLLGEGGMGAVYEAAPLDRPDQRCAIKVLHEEMSANPTVVERFLAEGDMCRRLDHPGVLRVFDVGQERGVPFLVMELLEGRALIDYTEHGQRLPLNFAVTVCAGVLHALDYAHSRGIIHRDLKPENVFLVPGPGGQWQTKLLDFGIARAIDAAGGGRRRTATGVLLGTPGYMSPEQVKAARNVDHRTDLWAIGVMFYEMVTGAQAFPSDGDDPNNIWGLISAVLTKEPVPLAVYDPHLAPFDAFIKHALCKDLEQRYPSARAMSEDLLRIARGEVRTSDPQSPTASPFTREQRIVPINSRGELPAIPAVDAHASPAAAQWAPPPPPQGAVLGTMPSGVQRPQGLDALSGTVPMAPGGGREHVTVDSYRGVLPRGAVSPQAAAMQQTALAPPGMPAMQQTALAPPGMQQTALAPAGASLAATALAPPDAVPPAPHVPKYATAPSGFRPPQPHVPSGRSPLEGLDNPPAREEAEPTSSPLPWIALGVVLIVALVGAVFWALH